MPVDRISVIARVKQQKQQQEQPYNAAKASAVLATFSLSWVSEKGLLGRYHFRRGGGEEAKEGEEGCSKEFYS